MMGGDGDGFMGNYGVDKMVVTGNWGIVGVEE